MSEIMKALSFVVYELLINQICTNFPVPKTHGEGDFDHVGNDEESQKVRLSINRIKRYFWNYFFSKVVS